MNKVVERIVADTKSVDEALEKVLKKIKDDLDASKGKRKKPARRKKA